MTEKTNQNYFDKANFLSKFLFCWSKNIYNLSIKEKLTAESLGTIYENFEINSISNTSRKYWNSEVNKGPKSGNKLLMTLVYLNIGLISIIFILGIILSLINLTQAYLFYKTLFILENVKDINSNTVLYCGIGYLVTYYFYEMIFRRMHFYESFVINKSQTELTTLLFSKIFSLANLQKNKLKDGDILTLFQSDVFKVSVPLSLMTHLFMCGFSLFIYGIALVYLFKVYALIILFIMILILLINSYFYYLIGDVNEAYMIFKEKRIKNTLQVLLQIKQVKLFSWSNLLNMKINENLNQENKSKLKANLCFVALTILLIFSQSLLFLLLKEKLIHLMRLQIKTSEID